MSNFEDCDYCGGEGCGMCGFTGKRLKDPEPEEDK